MWIIVIIKTLPNRQKFSPNMRHIWRNHSFCWYYRDTFKITSTFLGLCVCFFLWVAKVSLCMSLSIGIFKCLHWRYFSTKRCENCCTCVICINLYKKWEILFKNACLLEKTTYFPLECSKTNPNTTTTIIDYTLEPKCSALKATESSAQLMEVSYQWSALTKTFGFWSK